MTSPTSLDLTRDGQQWRSAPMPGASAPLDVVRLDSAPGTFVILGRFPAGFERTTVGGYDAAEEFVVLTGELVLDGRTLVRGDLTHVPAGVVRSGMHTEIGCTVLAWFSGRADFRASDELALAPVAATRTVSVLDVPAGDVLLTDQVRWRLESGVGRFGPHDDVIDLALTGWRRGGAPAGTAAPYLVRIGG
ncbi:MAG TPA: hypothetical protein VFE15_14295 [Marmoricola sp.]|jgi:hypothetical protein|nr:hypothetical protein [Marmoricola sp.]